MRGVVAQLVGSRAIALETQLRGTWDLLALHASLQPAPSLQAKRIEQHWHPKMQLSFGFGFRPNTLHSNMDLISRPSGHT